MCAGPCMYVSVKACNTIRQALCLNKPCRHRQCGLQNPRAAAPTCLCVGDQVAEVRLLQVSFNWLNAEHVQLLCSAAAGLSW